MYTVRRGRGQEWLESRGGKKGGDKNEATGTKCFHTNIGGALYFELCSKPRKIDYHKKNGGDLPPAHSHIGPKKVIVFFSGAKL